MPNAYILKDFDGGAEQTTLSAAMTSTANSFSVVDGSSYPSGTNPFIVVVDRGLATEEKILISGRIANSFSVLERAYDGSSAQNHALGAVVEHCLDAFTIEQANRYVNLQENKGDLVVHTGSTTDVFSVGNDDLVLIADSGASSGVRWGQVTEDSISETAIDAIADVVLGQISPGGLPAGVVVPYASAGAPAGWLACDGSLVSTTTYVGLFSVLGYTYGGSGSSFGLPNLQGRVPVGRDANQTEFNNLNVTGGAKTHTLIVGEMPAHNHTGSAASGGSHTHGYFDHPRNSAVKSASGADVQDRSSQADQTDSAGSHSHSLTIANTGGGNPHNNLQPYITLNYIIKT